MNQTIKGEKLHPSVERGKGRGKGSLSEEGWVSCQGESKPRKKKKSLFAKREGVLTGETSFETRGKKNKQTLGGECNHESQSGGGRALQTKGNGKTFVPGEKKREVTMARRKEDNNNNS